MKRFALVAALLSLAVFAAGGIAGASTPAVDVRLTNDCHPDGGCGAGYASNFTLATGVPYTDRTLAECTIAHGRQNEPAVAVNPRDTSVVVGSSNDYCGVYNQTDAAGNPVPLGPIWLGYYRSQTGGTSWVSSLVPGYPDDRSYPDVTQRPRTASSGDPVIAWDNHGRAFFGSESSDDPAGTPKTFGDVWVARFVNPDGPDAPNSARDGLEWEGTAIVARGSSAPNLLGKFNDKTAIEVDRTGGDCDGNVYFSWSRFTGNGGVGIYFVRSTDHGVTFSSPIKLTPSIHDVQFPDIAVTGNGHVYVAFREFAAQGQGRDALWIAKSTNCGRTFAPPVRLTTFIRSDAIDVADPEEMPQPQLQPDDPFGEEEGDAPGGLARDCGDFDAHCESGYTFFRRDTQVRATADQLDATREWIYLVYDATKPGTLAPTGTTYGTVGVGTGGQAATFFLRYDGGGAGGSLGPSIIDNQGAGHQVFPDISADGGILHAIWWDSRFDTCYSVTRPIGNCANRTTVPSLDVFGTASGNRGATWSASTKITDVRTNPNYEQFADRTVPFAGDYLWVTSLGNYAYAVWTDWRNTRPGTDPRELPEDEDAGSADVFQCRVVLSSTDKKGNTTTGWSGDRCPHAGGIDQNIYGDFAP